MHKTTNIGRLCRIQFSSKVALGHFRRIKLSTQALLTEEKADPRLIRDPLYDLVSYISCKILNELTC